MKKGIVIIFGKNDIDITNTLIFKPFFTQKIKICLVNNGNHDVILQQLNKLKDYLNDDVFILNLRKEKTVMAAVKAGVRFLSNKENISLIIHAQPNNINKPQLLENIIEIFKQDFSQKKEERVLLRSVYSVNEVLNIK